MFFFFAVQRRALVRSGVSPRAISMGFPQGGSTSAFYLDSLALKNVRELEIEGLDFPGVHTEGPTIL